MKLQKDMLINSLVGTSYGILDPLFLNTLQVDIFSGTRIDHSYSMAYLKGIYFYILTVVVDCILSYTKRILVYAYIYIIYIHVY